MTRWNPSETPILQLENDFYDSVQAAVFPQKKLRYWNDSLEFSFDKERLWDFKPLPANLPEPLALRYHGHQFQHYNPNLGDGRGFLYAQLQIQNQWYDLGTKGSGTTPYSRGGDGRLTLKGAVRETLATEMLQSLGVNTSKTVCFFETGENLERSDEPSPTRSAVLTRLSKGHIRIGTFQRLAFFRQIENIKKLTSYSLFFYYPEEYARIDSDDENLLASCFLQNVVKTNAELVAQVMMAGFVHGVLNTDNINISGELFDYGPYRFLPVYDPGFTAAYFDHQGLYCYGRQPVTFLWNLNQLAQALKIAYPHLPSQDILDGFSDEFNQRVQFHFLRRLNLKSQGSKKDQDLLTAFFHFMDSEKRPFEETFFQFHSGHTRKNVSSLNTQSQAYKNLLTLLEAYEPECTETAAHPYFQNEQPCTLLIDEIEAIWKPIAEKDDWSLFENKLQSIRTLRYLVKGKS